MDHINILRYLLLQYAMRLFKLTILVFVFSYFVGIYWYIFMSFFQENLGNHDNDEEKEHFINYTGFKHVIADLDP